MPQPLAQLLEAPRGRGQGSGSSALPLSQTEEQEGPFADMDPGAVQALQQGWDHSNEELKWWQFLDDLEPFLVRDTELSQEISDREGCSEEDLSQGEVSSSQEPSDWEEHIEQGLAQGDVISYEEVSDWEEPIEQIVSGGNGSRTSGHSSWEDDSYQELIQENWEEKTKPSIGTKPFHPEDDEWDEVSVLELPPEDKDQKWEVVAAEGLPVPVPREAWVEGPALEPCVPRKRPSCFRRALRALRGLLRWACLGPRTRD